ncbi:MAG: amidohydrolase [Thermoanaerobaculia bacterium]
MKPRTAVRVGVALAALGLAALGLADPGLADPGLADPGLAGPGLAGPGLHGLALVGPTASPPREWPPADLVLRGGAVYTVDAARSWAEAVAVRDGRIAWVGPDSGVERWIGPRTEIVDLTGRLLLPSFQDAHVHPLDAGLELGQCNLVGAADADEVLDRVAACAAQPPPGGWIVGTGWELPFFPDANPHRRTLDAVTGGMPALLWAADGHSAWANSEALALAGIDASTPDPDRGRIERDPDGSPSGTLREAAADLVADLLPQPSLEEGVAALRRAEAVLLPFGITSVQDARVDGAADLEAYRAAREAGAWRLRTVAALRADPARGLEQAEDLAALRERFEDTSLEVSTVKFFVDGVIEARTAYMLEPYTDRPGDRSAPTWPPEVLLPVAEELARRGFSLHLHAIGDAAVRLALDAVASARAVQTSPAARYQIAHLEVISSLDVPRFRSLGVDAGFQPLWAWADSYIRDLTWPALGPERSREIYPMASVHRAGGLLAFGSDWSVSSPDPLLGIEVALTRCDADLDPGDECEPMLPEEALDLPTALAAYTIGAAHANGLQATTGSIEVGKAADLVVLDRNLFEIPAAAISEARVERTILGGVTLFRHEAEAALPAPVDPGDDAD